MPRTKDHLFAPLYERQGHVCALCEEPLNEDPLLNDIDRIEEGGPYDLDNCRLVHHDCHRERHKNVPREGAGSLLDVAFHNRRLWLRTRRRLEQIQRGAEKNERTDDNTLAEFERLLARAQENEKYFTGLLPKALNQLNDPMVDALLSVPSTGPITAALWMTRVDVTRAPYASSIWRYFGYAGPTDDRYKKGERGGGSKDDRADWHMWARAQMMQRGPYRQEYDARRAKTDEQDRWNSDAHRMMDALRMEIKLFTSHAWQVERELRGLEVPDPYSLAELGHKHYIHPRERGWEY